MVQKLKNVGNKLKGWRTVALNGGLIVFGIVDYLDAAPLAGILAPQYAWVPIAIGAANVALRIVTNTAVFKKA